MKQSKSTVFVELPVIEKVISDYWKLRLDTETSLDDLSASQHWFALISKYADLVLDKTEDEFIELALNNPIYKKMLKSSQTGGSELVFWKSHLDDLLQDNRFEDFPTAIFLLNRDEAYCKHLTQSYGLIFLNGIEYKSLTGNLFLQTDIQVKKLRKRSDIASWGDVKKKALPMNTLILTDNYILKDKSDIAINLIPMLDALLPVKLENCKFQLMILTQEMEESIFNSCYSEVKKRIELLGRNYVIEFSLITAPKNRAHDRRIFTNYGLLESGNSFTYFDADGNIKKNTVLRVFPSCLVVSNDELMLNKNLNTLAEVRTIVEKHSRQSKGPGSEINNRLLAMVTD